MVEFHSFPATVIGPVSPFGNDLDDFRDRLFLQPFRSGQGRIRHFVPHAVAAVANGALGKIDAPSLFHHGGGARLFQTFPVHYGGMGGIFRMDMGHFRE